MNIAVLTLIACFSTCVVITQADVGHKKDIHQRHHYWLRHEDTPPKIMPDEEVPVANEVASMKTLAAQKRRERGVSNERKQSTGRNSRQLKPKSRYGKGPCSSKSSKNDISCIEDETSITMAPLAISTTISSTSELTRESSGELENPPPTFYNGPGTRMGDLVDLPNGFICSQNPSFMTLIASPPTAFGGQYPALIPKHEDETQNLYCDIRLTSDDAPTQFSSSAMRQFSMPPQNINMQFSMEVGYRLYGANDDNTKGLKFVIHQDPAGDRVIGDIRQRVGDYDGITMALVIELDTEEQTAPFDNGKIRVLLVDEDGLMQQELGETSDIQIRTDNAGLLEGKIWIDYNCENDNSMKIYLNSAFSPGGNKPLSPILELNVDLAGFFSNYGRLFTAGFTAEMNDQQAGNADVTSWVFASQCDYVDQGQPIDTAPPTPAPTLVPTPPTLSPTLVTAFPTLAPTHVPTPPTLSPTLVTAPPTLAPTIFPRSFGELLCNGNGIRELSIGSRSNPIGRFVNASLEQSFQNAVDCSGPNYTEENQQSHVLWAPPPLELVFELTTEFAITEVFFWNSVEDFHGVDGIEFAFLSSSNSSMIYYFSPGDGVNSQEANQNPLVAERFVLPAAASASRVLAYLTGDDGQELLGFQNIVFVSE
ncbi:legume lectin domain containing protein [Nitzschia inconspicua]|uniref:Legume lectin domain containing protein n=1 Tax=Nitzschia inconspicua TaxID=303405 RepID=A0A9K3PRL5_9STRA|nr:legume lectin domain containing protein [Nitzschia inconspicua]